MNGSALFSLTIGLATGGIIFGALAFGRHSESEESLGTAIASRFVEIVEAEEGALSLFLRDRRGLVDDEGHRASVVRWNEIVDEFELDTELISQLDSYRRALGDSAFDHVAMPNFSFWPKTPIGRMGSIFDIDRPQWECVTWNADRIDYLERGETIRINAPYVERARLEDGRVTVVSTSVTGDSIREERAHEGELNPIEARDSLGTGMATLFAAFARFEQVQQKVAAPDSRGDCPLCGLHDKRAEKVVEVTLRAWPERQGLVPEHHEPWHFLPLDLRFTCTGASAIEVPSVLLEWSVPKGKLLVRERLSVAAGALEQCKVGTYEFDAFSLIGPEVRRSHHVQFDFNGCAAEVWEKHAEFLSGADSEAAKLPEELDRGTDEDGQFSASTEDRAEPLRARDIFGASNREDQTVATSTHRPLTSSQPEPTNAARLIEIGSSGHLEVRPGRLDFGRAKLGDEFDGKFELQNLTNQSLSLGAAVTDCGCSVIDSYPTAILPGEIVEIAVSQQVSAIGRNSKHVALDVVAAGELYPLQLEITFDGGGSMQLDHEVVDTGVVVAGSEFSAELHGVGIDACFDGMSFGGADSPCIEDLEFYPMAGGAIFKGRISSACESFGLHVVRVDLRDHCAGTIRSVALVSTVAPPNATLWPNCLLSVADDQHRVGRREFDGETWTAPQVQVDANSDDGLDLELIDAVIERAAVQYRRNESSSPGVSPRFLRRSLVLDGRNVTLGFVFQ